MANLCSTSCFASCISQRRMTAKQMGDPWPSTFDLTESPHPTRESYRLQVLKLKGDEPCTVPRSVIWPGRPCVPAYAQSQTMGH